MMLKNKSNTISISQTSNIGQGTIQWLAADGMQNSSEFCDGHSV